MDQRASDEPAAATPYDECVNAIDAAHDNWRRGRITSLEMLYQFTSAFNTYFDRDDPRDDITLLIDYAETFLEEPNSPTSGWHGDRTMLAQFHQYLARRKLLDATANELGERLAKLTTLAVSNRAFAESELTNLCGNGQHLARRVFSLHENILSVLRVSHELSMVQPLLAAIHPDNANRGAIVPESGTFSHLRTAGFDYLADLAAGPTDANAPYPQTAKSACDALVELAGHIETAGSAITRLPVRRLQSDQLRKLERYLESYVEILTDDPCFFPDHNAHRLPAMIRDVLWLATDSRHFD